MVDPIQAIHLAKSRIRYARLKALPESEQIKAGRRLYDRMWHQVRNRTGDIVAICAVCFSCPYKTHVKTHLKNRLESLVDDPDCVIVGYRLTKKRDTDEHICAVVVATCDEKPLAIADIAAMSSILKIPTVGGNFHRESHLLPEQDAKELLKETTKSRPDRARRLEQDAKHQHPTRLAHHR